MPELPEVETIKLGLSSKITGLTIQSIEILNPKTFQGEVSEIVGKKVINVWRKAKVLGIDLEHELSLQSKTRVIELSLRGGNSRRGNLVQNKDKQDRHASLAMTLLFHLKMSGQLIYVGKQKLIGGHPTKDMLGDMPNRSTRVIFTFEDGSKLYFNDQRKFGWIKLISTDKIGEQSFLKSLGPEPLEEAFDWELLKQTLSRRQKTAIKVALLDQTVVSGIGNIYACEACFIAKIDPRKLVGVLKDEDYKQLVKGIVESLQTSIAYGGSSKQHYFNESGEKGYFLEKAFVYDRKGLPCRICQSLIEKIILGGRGTYYCPKCQKYDD